MITHQAILNRIAKTLHDNFEKFSWATTLGDKFEVWFQIEICLGFFGRWDGIPNEFHTINGNLLREKDLDQSTSYNGSKRTVDLLLAADGRVINDGKVAKWQWSQRVYAIELKAGIPEKKDDAHKDMHHALTPGQVQGRARGFKDQGMAVFIVTAQDTTIKGIRGFEGQVDRIVEIAREKYGDWTMLRNSDFASPNFMVVAITALRTEGLVLVHCQKGTLYYNPNWKNLLTYEDRQIMEADF